MSYYRTPILNEDGTEKHVFKEGARYHVLYYDTEYGIRCSEPNCEYNKKNTMKHKEKRNVGKC